MNRIGDLDDLALEQAAGVGIGQHDRGDIGPERGAHRGRDDGAVGARRNGRAPKADRAAVAGLVPWAESGTRTTLRALLPRAAIAALIAIMPQSSPCAPALGDIATASMPVMTSASGRVLR